MPDNRTTEELLKDIMRKLERIHQLLETELDNEKRACDKDTKQWNAWGTKCHKCGLQLPNVIVYVCNVDGCPTFGKVTC